MRTKVHVPMRSAELPTALAFCHSDQAAAHALVDALGTLGSARVLFAAGGTGRRLLASSLRVDCGSHFACATLETAGAHLEEVERIRAAVREHDADVVVACGGGQTLDAAKYAAFQDDVPLVSIPTQASHDGICSPVAVLKGPGDARASSYGARPPAALLVPVHVITRSPRRTLVSGIADLAVNLLAVEDWRWAHEFRGEPFDDYSALLSQSAAQLVVGRRALFGANTDFTAEDVEILVYGLVLSGLAMTLAGSSRPCSGSEHLISHAFDLLGVGHGTHGEQVAVGAALASRLYAVDFEPMLELLRRVGAPLTPAALGIERPDAERAVKMAHLVRPERNSRLSAAIVADPGFVDELVHTAWYS